MSRQLVCAICALLMALGTAGCGGGSSGGAGDGSVLTPPQDADINGAWEWYWDQSDPPRVASCSSGPAANQFVIYLECQVTQNAQSFTATCQPVYAGFAFSTSGTVSGNTAAGTLVRSDGTYTDRIQYTATISGDTMTIQPTAYTQDWNPGYSCTCTGAWVVSRV